MPFISAASLAKSWHTLNSEKVPSNFFCFLCILKLISAKDGISGGKEFHFKADDLSNLLEELFFFGDSPKQYTKQDSLWVLFPPDWPKIILADLLANNPPDILDVAKICLHNQEFDAGSNATQVIDRFTREFHVQKELLEIFSKANTDIEFSEKRPLASSKKKAITSALGIEDNPEHGTLTLEGSIKSRPGALGQAPFFQTLYSSLSIPRCLLVTPFNFLETYGINQSIASPTLVSEVALNKIVYGAPGSGKSYFLNSIAQQHFQNSNISRVTFHPSFSYYGFVGSYKPNPIYQELPQTTLFDSDKIKKLEGNEQGKVPIIDYSFVPGIFIQMLIKALNNPKEKFLLIIEEINRANVPAVFGEVFQLLDRKENGESQFPVRFNPDLSSYLTKKVTSQDFDASNVFIPGNYFLWATMNSADQGVQPLDSAFKRRWNFEYIGLNQHEDVVSTSEIRFQRKSLSWNSFRKRINDKLIEIGISEDKLIAPFFLTRDELLSESAIKNKLLLYLRDDLVRHNPMTLFNKKTFSEIVRSYDEGEDIFNFPID